MAEEDIVMEAVLVDQQLVVLLVTGETVDGINGTQ